MPRLGKLVRDTISGLGSKTRAEPVTFTRTQDRRAEIPAVPSIPLPPDADPFAWARDLRQREDHHPRDKVLAQVIAERVQKNPAHPRYGKAWPSRHTMAGVAPV